MIPSHLEKKYGVGKELASRFINRTDKHIQRVIKNAEILDRAFPGNFPGLLDQAREHDQSKYNDPECLPYIWLTEWYRCKDSKIPFTYPDGMEDRTRQASLQHIRNNKHHPEYWDQNKDKIELNKDRDSANQPQVTDATKMDDVSLAEQVCDWMSMSQEKGTSLKEWADNTINKRWKFTDDQVKLLYELVDFFEDKDRVQSWLKESTHEDGLVTYRLWSLRGRSKSVIESIIDATRTQLDPMVFDKFSDKYTMRADVASFIKSVVEQINNEIVNVSDYFIKGSILSFQWLDNTDVDLLIETEVGEDDRRRIQDTVDTEFVGVVIPGTKHPLQIYINSGKYNPGNADGMYRIDTGWVKGPYNIRVQISDYMSKFNKVVGSIDISTGELKRDIIDYEILKKLPKDEVAGLEAELNKKLGEINKDVDGLVFQYKHIRDMRHKAFSDDITPQEIIKYGSKNSLPENVVFKLLERYYYLSTMRKIKEIADDGITDDEVGELKDAIDGQSDN